MKKRIEYSQFSWNSYHGCLMTGCKVGKRCWAYRRALMLGANPQVKGYPSKDPFKPIFEPDKLDIPLKRKTPTIWNTCFMGDIAYAKKEWLEEILEVVHISPQHIFYFLTKRPDLVQDKFLSWPDNAWVGTTVNSQDDIWRIGNLKELEAKNLWVSFEPLYGKILTSLSGVNWIVIGAQTSPELQPDIDWVMELIRCADYLNIPVFLKPNLMTVPEPRMELPEAIRKVSECSR